MTPKFFDVHSHPNFAAFDKDRDEVMKRALNAEVFMNVVGTQKDTSKQAVELAEKYEGVYATVGLHPIHTGKSFHDKDEIGESGQEFTSRGEKFDYDFYKKLASHPKVVAIGECGLDYYHDTNTRMDANDTNKRQEETFRKQIELAIGVKKPLMLHLRNGVGRSAYRDAFDIINTQYGIRNTSLRGNLHFFAGTIDEAKPFLSAGFYFSFTGVITFTKDYDEIIKYLPLDKIMAETDCPFVAPMPHRGKRNEPIHVIEVVKKIAEIRGADFEKVRAALLQNSFAFFNLSC
ncbi:MAG: hydrolase, TatD family [Parcubacteria group bacterium Gr01-1014_73]|nr:MAG: hydrolase, TatD family [Parcubacteria group bacterium Gr01-1014_73]